MIASGRVCANLMWCTFEPRAENLEKKGVSLSLDLFETNDLLLLSNEQL